MQEHLKRIRIPVADGSTHELVIPEETDYGRMEAYAREQAATVRADLSAKVVPMAEFFDALMTGGPEGLARHVILHAVSQPAGNYNSLMLLAEHLWPGCVAAMFQNWNISARNVADHFPDIIAIVGPEDACFVQPAAAYVPGGTYFAWNGLLLRSRLNTSPYAPWLYPRNVDWISYWNFSTAPYLLVEEKDHRTLDREAVPYQPPAAISGLTNMASCQRLSLIDRTGRSRLKNMTFLVGERTPEGSTVMDSALRDWVDEGCPHNEVELLNIFGVLDTHEQSINSLFAGLRSVKSFPKVTLTGCEGTHLFQRNPDRLPDSAIARRALIDNIGFKNDSETPQTDLSGLVGWNLNDMEFSLRYAVTPAVPGWRILLSKDCYSRLSSTLLASLTAKGFTVVNAG